MPAKRRVSFYEACFLVANDYQVMIEQTTNKPAYYVLDSGIISEELNEFLEEYIQRYTRGIITFKKQLRAFWKDQKRTSPTGSLPVSSLVESSLLLEDNSYA